MRAFVCFVVIAVATGNRVGPPPLPVGKAGKALANTVQHVKNVKPPIGTTVIKNLKPQRILPPTGPVPKGIVPRPNLATRNGMPRAAEDGIMKAIMKPPAAEGGVMQAITKNGKTSKPSSGIMSAIMGEQPGLPQTPSDATQSDNPLAVAGQQGSRMVKIKGVDLQFGTDEAKAAILSMNWNPTSEDANKILKDLECWPGQPPCDKKREAVDWVKDYIGGDKYSSNVCKVTRGDLASTTSDRTPAACFNSNSVTTEQATGCAFEYGVALSAALSLVEAPSVKETGELPTLYRGAKLPLDLVQKLEGLAGGKETFTMGGMTSGSANERWAKRFMGRKGTAEDVEVLYEIHTDKAKSVETALGDQSWILGSKKPEEWESILPPGQNFEVLSVEATWGGGAGDHYRVILQDPS